MQAGVSGEESDGEGGREGNAMSLKMQREKLEEEKKSLLENKEILKEVYYKPFGLACLHDLLTFVTASFLPPGAGEAPL